jgi:hypothetical protein
MNKINRKRWSKREFENMKQDRLNGMSFEDISLKYNRGYYAVQRKFFRGHKKDGRLSKYSNPRFIKKFRDDYFNKKLETNQIVNIYGFDNKQQVYQISHKLKIQGVKANV